MPSIAAMAKNIPNDSRLIIGKKKSLYSQFHVLKRIFKLRALPYTSLWSHQDCTLL